LGKKRFKELLLLYCYSDWLFQPTTFRSPLLLVAVLSCCRCTNILMNHHYVPVYLFIYLFIFGGSSYNLDPCSVLLVKYVISTVCFKFCSITFSEEWKCCCSFFFHFNACGSGSLPVANTVWAWINFLTFF